MYRNNMLMLILTTASLFCLIVLAGLYAYTGGSILPQTQHMMPSEARALWIEWFPFVGIPVLTAIFWILRLGDRRSK
jgi:hypothetical protein